MRWLTTLLAPFAFLYLLGTLFRAKHRKTFKGRLGLGFPKKGKSPLVWIHAVSVGETKAIIPLAKKLMQEGSHVLISSVTATGHETAKKELKEAAYHLFLPFDFWFIIAPLVKRLAPEKMLISETDLWPNFLQSCKQSGAKIFLVNGKISEKSFKRTQRFLFLTKRWLYLIDHFCVQGPLYAKRFAELGIPEEKITITGNLKLSHRPTPLPLKQKDALANQLGISQTDFVLTLGSTHAPEEKLFIDTLPALLKTCPSLQLLIVPRHPERFDEVAKLLLASQIPFSRYTESPCQEKVVLIDTMGLLIPCYQLSHLAFVGGTFVPTVGGHNLAEPAFFNVPTLFGPYTDAQPDLTDLLLSYRGGCQITLKSLQPTLETLLTCTSTRNTLSRNATKALSAPNTALKRTYEKVIALNTST